MVEDMLFRWLVGLVMYLLFVAHDGYRVGYAPVRTEVSTERSRHEQ